MPFVLSQDALSVVVGEATAAAWIGHLRPALKACGADASARRTVHFLGQFVGHETQGLTRLTESLYYTDAERLVQLFRVFKSVEQARAYLRNEQALGNKIYAGRNGNGPSDSGDGFDFRGRGLPMLTGRKNYQAFADAAGCPEIVTLPDILARDKPLAAGAAAWFWKTNGCNAAADTNSVEAVTRTINPACAGLKGKGGREDWTGRFAAACQSH